MLFGHGELPQAFTQSTEKVGRRPALIICIQNNKVNKNDNLLFCEALLEPNCIRCLALLMPTRPYLC